MNNKKLFWQDLDTIKLLADSLKKNRISITSTDTILGFLCNLTEDAFTSLNELKQERIDKPYLILISSFQKLDNFIKYSELSENVLNLMQRCWPGPLTIIFKAKEGLPKFLTSKYGTVAIRMPKHNGLQKLLGSFDGLFSTSANKSSQIPPETIQQIDAEILNKVEYVILDKNNKDDKLKELLSKSLPSSIIDFSDEKEVVVVREGAYSIKELEYYYGAKFKKG